MKLTSIKNIIKTSIAFVVLTTITTSTVQANPVAKELHAFFDGGKQWHVVVDQVVAELETNKVEWIKVIGSEAEVAAIIAALRSVQTPGKGANGLKRIKAVLDSYAHIIEKAVPDVWAKVTRMGDIRILSNCSHLVR
jgi:hypothetical protein